MSKYGSKYTHKKFPKRVYESWYRWTTGEREFMLSTRLKSGMVHNISFESWNSAIAQGWLKIGRGRKTVEKSTGLQKYKDQIKRIREAAKGKK